MAFSILRVVTIAYVLFNILITLIVSFFGVTYVRTEFKLQNEREQNVSLQIKISKNDEANNDGQKHINTNNEPPDDDMKSTEEQKDNDKKNEKTGNIENNANEEMMKLSKMAFVKLWFKIVWKMRTVYLSLAVHAFDVLTDILVIMQWWTLEDEEGDIQHINARIMAWCGIATLLFHKLISTIAFWMKEQNIYRCIFQLLDVLIFEEIYISHKKIVSQFRNQKQSKSDNDKDAVETTTSFKYIRSLEAVFESIPQSVLQTVFIVRTGGRYDIDILIVSFLSIFQSIVSMTNSIIKNDNIYMNTPRFKKHKKRLPPTIPFLKHALCRLSEVFYRIALLSLFWSVCGGEAFAILLAVELLFIFSLTGLERVGDIGINAITMDELFLRVQALVILPSEMVFSYDGTDEYATDLKEGYGWLFGCCWTCCCCYAPAIWISTLCRKRDSHYIHCNFRIGVSMVEWIIMIIYALAVEGQIFIFSPKYGLSIFIISIILFFVYTQYLYLFPDFSLPYNVSVRSKFGYALNGELEELQRMKEKPVSFNVVTIRSIGDKKRDDIESGFNQIIMKHINNICGVGWTDTDKDIKWEGYYWNLKERITISVSQCINLQKMLQDEIDELHGADNFRFTLQNPWEVPPKGGGEYVTCSMFALANGHHHIAEWLEKEKGATKHIELFQSQSDYETMSEEWARSIVDVHKEYF